MPIVVKMVALRSSTESGLIFRVGAWNTLDHHVAAKFAGNDDQGAVELPSFLQVAD